MRLKLLYVAAALSLSLVGWFGYKTYVYYTKVTFAFEYLFSGMECMIMENGQNEGDVEILFRGFKSRRAYYEAVQKEAPGLYSKDEIEKKIKRPTYNSHIPACEKFYSEYRCWMLDPKNHKSLDNCGAHFGYLPEEIELLKKDPSKSEEVWKALVKRGKSK